MSLPSSPAGFEKSDKGIESSCCVRSSVVNMYAWWEKKVVVGEGKQESVWHSFGTFPCAFVL